MPEVSGRSSSEYKLTILKVRLPRLIVNFEGGESLRVWHACEIFLEGLMEDGGFWGGSGEQRH